MRDFTKADYEIYPDATDYRNGEKPQIHELKSGLDIIADWHGVMLYGYVGTKAIAYQLYKSRIHIKRSTDCAAKEWIEELEHLQKHEQVALIRNVGIE